MRFEFIFRKSIFLLKHLSFSDEVNLQMVSQVLERGMSNYCMSRHILNLCWIFIICWGPTKCQPLRL